MQPSQQWTELKLLVVRLRSIPHVRVRNVLLAVLVAPSPAPVRVVSAVVKAAALVAAVVMAVSVASAVAVVTVEIVVAVVTAEIAVAETVGKCKFWRIASMAVV